MEEKLCFVQFTHPGGEHKPDKDTNHKGWNYGRHQRKFLKMQGNYVFGDKLEQNKTLLFWGEWEPCSETEPILEKPKGDFPQFIHRPFFDSTFPLSKTNAKEKIKYRQNTDPYVYGDQFHYCCCKQWKKRKEIPMPTQLARLSRGSIILFGSTINQNTEFAYFALDTVFVVDKYIEYNAENFVSKLRGKVSDEYFEITIKSAYSKTIKEQEDNNKKPEVRCYFGATYDNRVSGMYSFVPCKEFTNNKIGFERAKLTNNDFDYISNNLNAAPKMNPTDKINDNVLRWNLLRDFIKNKGFYEGVRFDFNK